MPTTEAFIQSGRWKPAFTKNIVLDERRDQCEVSLRFLAAAARAGVESEQFDILLGGPLYVRTAEFLGSGRALAEGRGWGQLMTRAVSPSCAMAPRPTPEARYQITSSHTLR